MKMHEFKENGKCLSVYTEKTPTAWFNMLFNDEYVLNASQRMCGASFSVKEYKQIPVMAAEKYFYVKIDGEIYKLCAGRGKSYECRHYLHKTVVYEDFGVFSSSITCFVPAEGRRELWRIKLLSEKKQKAEIFAGFPFENIDCQGMECRFDAGCDAFIKTCFPYYITLDEHEKAAKNIQRTFVKSSLNCDSFECNQQRFFGGDDPYDIPDMVKNGKGTCKSSEFEKCIAAFCHKVTVDGEKSIEYLISDISDNKDFGKTEFPDFEAELLRAERCWNNKISSFFVSCSDKKLEYMTNYWLKKQVIYLTKFNRGGVYCPVRNQLQDALGYSMVDAKDAFGYALKVLIRQEETGYLKQWYMTDGSQDTGLCRLSHSDAPIWLVICMTEIIKQTGDMMLFDKKVRYKDSEKEDTILEHLKKAITYMSTQLGAHGLCLMKDGDWTDPINAAGHLGKGESVWNTLALIYAAKRLNEIAEDESIIGLINKLTEKVNTYCWDGDRYIVGFNDDGIPFGKSGDKEGALFINTQAWALMAGVCDGIRTDKVRKTIDELRTEYGYRLLMPAFSEYNRIWGKISVKQKGATENGSVYSHATAFKAYADCVAGDFDAAIKTLENLMPKDDAIQAPMYLPNYYFGLDGDNFGRSSCVFSSGAPAWVLWIMKKYFA